MGFLGINKYLISEVLKKMNFAGFTLSDWEDYIKLHKEHLTDSTIEMAIALHLMLG